jgi:hypothetical protein
MKSQLHVVRCCFFSTDYRPLTTIKCYSSCDLPAIASHSGEVGGAKRTNMFYLPAILRVLTEAHYRHLP